MTQFYIDIQISKNGGHTWGDWRKVPYGDVGDFPFPIITRRWGSGRHIVIRWRITDPVRANLIAASIQAEPA